MGWCKNHITVTSPSIIGSCSAIWFDTKSQVLFSHKSCWCALCLALGYFLGLGLSPLSSFIAAAFLMPATPPPSPPPPSSAFQSFELHQQAIRQQERLQRDRQSPELRRVPSASTTHSTVFPPPPPPISAPVTFNGQSFSNLPPNIVARMRDLQPFPTLRRQRNAVQSNVSITFTFF